MVITKQLIQSTLKKVDAHMRSVGCLSYSTRQSYLPMIGRFLRWEQAHWDEILPLSREKRMGAFLSAIANDKGNPISFGTQKSYWCAILYFYREFEGKPMGKITAVKAAYHQRIPNIMSEDQLRALFGALAVEPSNYKLLARLMFGTGMRIEEALRLRTKDIRFEQGLIAIQEGKGDKSRLVDLPHSIVVDLKAQLEYARKLYDADRADKRPGVSLPNGLAKKYPAYPTSWEWFWVFPHWQEGKDEDGQKRRHHVYPFHVQGAFRAARAKADLPEYVIPHQMRHGYATFYLRNMLKRIKQCNVEIPDLYGYCREALKKKLGHVSAQTTEMYIHLAMDRDDISDVSPLDILEENHKERQ